MHNSVNLIIRPTSCQTQKSVQFSCHNIYKTLQTRLEHKAENETENTWTF